LATVKGHQNIKYSQVSVILLSLVHELTSFSTIHNFEVMNRNLPFRQTPKNGRPLKPQENTKAISF